MLMTQLEIVSTKIHQKLGQISADSCMVRKVRVDLGEEMKKLENKRRRLMAKQHQAVREMMMEAASMEQNLLRWHGQESKFTKRIEKSR